jgi:hypothetical protein
VVSKRGKVNFSWTQAPRPAEIKGGGGRAKSYTSRQIEVRGQFHACPFYPWGRGHSARHIRGRVGLLDGLDWLYLIFHLFVIMVYRQL